MACGFLVLVEMLLVEAADENAVKTGVETTSHAARTAKHTFEQGNRLPREELRMRTDQLPLSCFERAVYKAREH